MAVRRTPPRHATGPRANLPSTPPSLRGTPRAGVGVGVGVARGPLTPGLGLSCLFRTEGPLPPPPQTKGTIAGNNEIYNREHLVGPFLVHKLFGLKPPPPSPPPHAQVSAGDGKPPHGLGVCIWMPLVNGTGNSPSRRRGGAGRGPGPARPCGPGGGGPGTRRQSRTLTRAYPRLDRRLEGVAKAVGSGYCRLQMPLRPALGVRGTVAGRRLGALEGGGMPPLLPTHP